jgi:hypothetical protein
MPWASPDIIKENMLSKDNFKSLKELVGKRTAKKPPAFEWQDLALRVIDELNIPKNKRSSVFRVCKQYSRQIVERAMNDTKELCKTGEKWRYFFKLIDKK